jgi:uroporphyrin-III C-methyltransferase
LTLTLAEMAHGDAQDWLDASQPSLLMIGEAFAERALAETGQAEAALQAAA